eukprot:755318-Hanusia_phi.AAC.2
MRGVRQNNMRCRTNTFVLTQQVCFADQWGTHAITYSMCKPADTVGKTGSYFNPPGLGTTNMVQKGKKLSCVILHVTSSAAFHRTGSGSRDTQATHVLNAQTPYNRGCSNTLTLTMASRSTLHGRRGAEGEGGSSGGSEGCRRGAGGEHEDRAEHDGGLVVDPPLPLLTCHKTTLPPHVT